MSQGIRFVDPRAQPAVQDRPYELTLDLPPDGGGVTVGLLANGFPDSVEFLDAVGEALLERLPKLRLERFNKGNASITAPADLLDGITKECKAVVAAYGH